MSHAFRLHTRGSQTLDGWDASKQYSQNEINDIVDPSGATASLPITSVPTPFASLELARNAFEICGAVDSKGKNYISGDSIYHKIVSFSLDTLEIFFNIKKFDAVFEIIPWNVSTQIGNLLRSGDVAHERLGQTLKLYLEQDAQAFNFSPNLVFYLLNYKNGPASLNIVGGTSPTSLAVASTNDLYYVDVPLSGNHKAYDDNPSSFRTLIERDPDFIKYVWTLHQQNGFSNVYPALYKYIEECFKQLKDRSLKDELLKVTASDIQLYTPIVVGAANIMLPGNIILSTYEAPSPDTVSDFTIKADFPGNNLPLVLPNSLGYNEQEMRYVSGPWNAQVKAPYTDPRPMGARTLPDNGTQYPYLTADDVFQPYIIRTAFPIDEKAYFLAHFKNNGKYSYLLPLKKEIFQYLSLDTICGMTKGPHAMNVFELKDLAGGGVEAVFNIPIQKGKYITFRRCYMDITDEPQVEQNKGVVVECTFDLYLYPSYHIANADNVATPQRAYLLDGDFRELTKSYDYSVELFKADQSFGTDLVTSVIQRAEKSVMRMTSKMFVASEEFDIVQVSNGVATGLLIPKYKQVGNGTDSFEFAIDFGTTNTHVEYRVNNGQVTKPLEMTLSDSAILALHPNDSHYQVLFDKKGLDTFSDAPYQEFLPTLFGAKEITGFPLRTNICMGAVNTASQGVKIKETLGDYAIGFHYERQSDFNNNKTITNLKWLGDGNQQYVSSFFEELLLLIRSKVLMNGGGLKKTTIMWFYPVSMEPFRLSQLSDEWSKLCHHLIDEQCPVLHVTESLAPFYYYKNNMGVNAAYRPVVLMDIGGGTTDFAVYANNQPKLISSVRFAGNSIYGDFPGFGIQMNGFCNRYVKWCRSNLEQADVLSLQMVFDNLVNNAVSADVVSFLYSLERNAELKKKGHSISFSDSLKADYQLKTTLLLFFVAEIYYLAHVLKAKGVGTPAYLTVSGTGSKVLDLIGGQKQLESIIRIVFNDVIGDDGKVELKRVENPKEITCKGGLNMQADDVVDDPEDLCYCFTGASTIDVHSRLQDIDEDAMNQVLAFYHTFVDYFFALNNKYSFDKNFGIKTLRSFAEYKQILLEHAHEDLAAVLDVRKKEREDPDAELEDSMFFFPLAGGLNRLSYYISKQDQK